MAEDKAADFDIEKRRNKIVEMLNLQRKVKVADLSKLFGISEVTIRNDLAELEMQGLLERVHGGAVSTHLSYYNMTFMDHLKTNEEEKKRIAREAASLVADGDTIILSSGTTIIFLVRELKKIKNLTIVTNSVLIAQEVINQKNLCVILLGGNLNTDYQFTYGDDTVTQLKNYRADKLFLSADGISAAGGITTYHHLEAEVGRQMIARVKQTIILADYTKIGVESFARISDIDIVDCLITNSGANGEEVTAIKEKGVEVRQV